MASIADAQGIYLYDGQPITDTLAAARAGSTHYLLADGTYELWATQDCLVFFTVAGTDPPADQAAQTNKESLAYVPSRAIFRFEFVAGATAFKDGVSIPSATGIRVVRLGATAGTFYLNENRRRT